MDKSILKKFAIEQRKSLEEKVKDRLSIYYATEKDVDIKESGDTVNIKTDKGNNLVLSKIENEHRNRLKSRIEKIGISQVIEEASFTWFNRIIAIRYMELHDFLPLTKDNESLNIRVLSSSDGTSEPDIMKNQNLHNSELDLNINFTELDKITNINDKYEKVLLSICYKLGKVLPQIFDGETDYIDLLIPKNLLNKDSFLDKLINEVPEDNFNDIEIIGWFYQYYNQSEKDKAMKEKRAYKKTEIPYVTQIFTPDWIVKYMVENSLGRLWVEKNGDEEIIKEFKYFIKDNIEIDNKGIMPENITFIDPCMGSGHILVYAFEVFVKLYMQAGYNKKDIPEKILKNNLYGLDIDDRAGQFAIISIMLKAREYDKDIFNKIEFNKLNILSIQETDNYNDLLQCARSIREADIKETAEYLIETFKNAKEIGSLLIVEDRDYDKLAKYLDTATSTVMNMLLRDSLKDVIRVAKILSKKYDVVVTNPPYMPTGKMSDNGKKYLELFYKDSKTDLCTTFMEIRIVDNDRYLGMINMHSWMFLSSYDELRKKVLNNFYLTTMLHLGAHAFEEMSGEVIQTTSFILKKSEKKGKGIYHRLSEIPSAEMKEKAFFDGKKMFIKIQTQYKKIPGNIIGYWISDIFLSIFEKGTSIDDISDFTGSQNITSDNEKYLRFFWEVENKLIGKNKKYAYYAKGGEYRKWYGNIELVVKTDVASIKFYKECKTANYLDEKLWFTEGITYTAITSKGAGFRYYPPIGSFDKGGPTICNVKNMKYCLAILNSKIANKVFYFLNPTINLQVQNVKALPLIFTEDKEKMKNANDLSDKNISISKTDWDSFETSCDFKKHPLV